MTTATADAPALAIPAGPGDLAGLEPVERLKRRWPFWLGVAVTLLMVAGIARKLFEGGLAGLEQSVPDSPMFYIAFLAAYMALPLGDWVIFRKLWRLPISGLVPIVKKTVANDVVFGYSGEAYFYAWARQHANLTATPFGAVKDVSILSAIAGNAFTLLLLLLAVPFAGQLLPAEMARNVMGSAAIIMGISLLVILFGKRVFSLGKRLLWWIFGAHFVRSILQQILTAAAWYYALPDVPWAIWLVLGATRMLVGRLPLIPQKELVFASFAILLIGHDDVLSSMIAFTATLTLLVHMVLLGTLSIYSFSRKDI